jgi:hypothetical protein
VKVWTGSTKKKSNMRKAATEAATAGPRPNAIAVAMIAIR